MARDLVNGTNQCARTMDSLLEQDRRAIVSDRVRSPVALLMPCLGCSHKRTRSARGSVVFDKFVIAVDVSKGRRRGSWKGARSGSHP